MTFLRFLLVCFVISSLTSCASRYKMIEPESLNYLSVKEDKGVKFEYKYDLLDKKYAKKEDKKGVRLVAVKITNNSGKDITFGKDVKLTYESGNEVYVMENEKAFKTLRQSTASYLFYLLLTPVNLYQEETRNGYVEQENIFPIGLILGPGIAGGNMIVSSTGNNKFKEELLEYDINGKVIKDGETQIGLISIQSESYDALMLKME